MLSIIMTALFAVLYKMGALKGGDFKILTIISWFCPLNPLNPNDTFFQIQFVIFLSAVAILWMIYVYFKNRRTDLFNGMSLWQKFNDYPRGSPWMVPIAIAFVITAVLG
jgi:Flp pilus assembly protein protease CpaA